MTQIWPATQVGVRVTAPAAQLLPLKVCVTPVTRVPDARLRQKLSDSVQVFWKREICGLAKQRIFRPAVTCAALALLGNRRAHDIASYWQPLDMLIGAGSVCTDVARSVVHRSLSKSQSGSAMP
jgi:hypothetical protein